MTWIVVWTPWIPFSISTFGFETRSYPWIREIDPAFGWVFLPIRLVLLNSFHS